MSIGLEAAAPPLIALALALIAVCAMRRPLKIAAGGRVVCYSRAVSLLDAKRNMTTRESSW